MIFIRIISGTNSAPLPKWISCSSDAAGYPLYFIKPTSDLKIIPVLMLCQRVLTVYIYILPQLRCPSCVRCAVQCGCQKMHNIARMSNLWHELHPREGNWTTLCTYAAKRFIPSSFLKSWTFAVSLYPNKRKSNSFAPSLPVWNLKKRI